MIKGKLNNVKLKHKFERLHANRRKRTRKPALDYKKLITALINYFRDSDDCSYHITRRNESDGYFIYEKYCNNQQQVAFKVPFSISDDHLLNVRFEDQEQMSNYMTGMTVNEVNALWQDMVSMGKRNKMRNYIF